MVVLGLDLSLTGIGVVAVPMDWDLRWHCIQRVHFGSKSPKEASNESAITRRNELARKVAQHARLFRAQSVWIEGGLTRGAHHIATLAMLRSAVELRLVDELGLYANTAHQASARKLFLGHVPRKGLQKGDLKKLVVGTVRQMPGFAGATDDECDAFVAANWGLSELGGCCLASAA